jgi:uncharacterized surface protein with fasciclin (FAS1) repeats
MNFLKTISASILTLTLVTNINASAQTNIVGTASSEATLSTLVSAIKAADLTDTLSDNGPFTVLAPTNDAFNKLPAGVLANLLKPENKDTLSKILKYHVISGTVKASKIVTLTTSKTVESSTIKIKTTGNTTTINDSATVTKTDISASNGVIHLIDAVLVPPTVNISSLTTTNAVSSSSLSAVSSTNSTSSNSIMDSMMKTTTTPVSSAISSSSTAMTTVKASKDSTIRSGGFSIANFIVLSLVLAIGGLTYINTRKNKLN